MRGREHRSNQSVCPSATKRMTLMEEKTPPRRPDECVETASPILVTTSKCSIDGVRAFGDDVRVADIEKPGEDSTG
ncbi:hypothetical protein Tco_1391426 [Tanacetum coccineum]